jgi:hypothetical protein
MPNYKGHLAGGAVFYTIAFLVLTFTYKPTIVTSIEWLLFTLMGALFPDVDIRSKGQKLFYWLLGFIFLYAWWNHHLFVFPILSAIGLVPLLVKHRGIFHRLWFIILLSVGLAFLACQGAPNCYRIIMFDTLFFLVGAISHLWLDLGLRRMFRF